jgi:hypothetical protein
MKSDGALVVRTSKGADLHHGCPSTRDALFLGAWNDWARLHDDLIQEELLLLAPWVRHPA